MLASMNVVVSFESSLTTIAKATTNATVLTKKPHAMIFGRRALPDFFFFSEDPVSIDKTVLMI